MDNKSIGITIGITAFNEGSLLSDAWKSVLGQSTGSWQAVLILDGGGNRKTRKIFDSINHINIVKHSCSNNIGAYHCRTKAIELSTTDWYFHLDADDMLPPNSIELVLDNIQNAPDAEFIAGACKHFSMGPDQMVYPKTDPDLLAVSPLFIATSPIKKKLLREMGGYHIPYHFFHADWDFWLSVFEKNIVGHTTNDIFYHRRRRNNSLTWQNLHNLEGSLELIISRHPHFFKSDKRKNRARYELQEKLARHYKSLGNRKKAVEHAKKALNFGEKSSVFETIFQEERMSFIRFLLRRMGRHLNWK